MQKFSDAAAIERKIGYVFRDKALLQTCFTHSSYSNRFGGENNERLEFLGDAALGFLAAELLFERGGSEGEMTKARIRMVSAKPLEEAVRRLGVAEYLLTSGDAGGKAVSSLYEALVAGIYLDGGIEQARAFVARSLPSDLPEPNYKGDLQEFCRARIGSARSIPCFRRRARRTPRSLRCKRRRRGKRHSARARACARRKRRRRKSCSPF